MMRVAYICTDPGVPVFGRKGSSVHVQAVVRALAKRGAQVDLFAARWDGSNPPGFEHIRCQALPLPPKGDRAVREQTLLAANDHLAIALRKAGPFDLIYERYGLWSYAGMEYAQTHDIPGLLEVNAPLIEEQAQHRGLVHRREAERVADRVFGAATVLLAVSDGVAAYLNHHPAAQDRVLVVPNGVDPDRFPPDLRPTLSRDPETFVIGFVGTLKPWHGLDTLLDAFAMLQRHAPHVRLLLVGDGPERAPLEAEVRERRLDHAVEFTGAVDPAAIPGLLRSIDAAVAPYPALHDFYFSPLKLYEYMAAGVPVVASAIGQIQNAITDEVNGLLCPPGDAQALAQALDWLRRDPALRSALGAAGRETVIRDHTWDAVADRILSFAALPAGRG
jgi:glycosyltransferase involved in cell wall biosynthesis